MARRSNPEPDQTEAGDRRICMITGGTGGIGLSAAMAIGASGYDLLLVGRSTAQGATAVQRVDAVAHRPAATFLQADLSSRAEVMRLAAAVRNGWPRLDALVHSAGTVQQRRRESIDGVELTWAVNHLAPFLLTYLLLGTLQVSAPSRVIVVSSRSHRWGRIHWADPELHRGYNLLRAYSQSKLANLLFVQELDQRLSGLGVYATVVHPGLVRTGIARDVSGLAAVVWRTYAHLLGQPVEEGAAPIVRVATDPDPARWSGLYVGPGGPERPSSRSLRSQDAARLWHLSVERLGLPPD